MAKYSPEAKARRAASQPERMRHARKKLLAAGFTFIEETDNMLVFLFRAEKVRFYPYTGWATGKSITDGRGLENLLKQLAR